MDRTELGQSLNLSEELVAAGRGNRPGTALRPRSITVHNTSNTNSRADASAHSRFIRNNGFYTLPSGKKNWVSWHFSVDDVRAIKHLPLSERAFHAGPANAESIAIEVCMHREIDQPAANARAARLVAALLFDFRLGKEAIRSHKSWTGKACPVLLLPRWTGFVDEVAALLASITAARGIEDSLIGDDEQAALDAPLPEADETASLADEPDIDHDELAFAIARDAP